LNVREALMNFDSRTLTLSIKSWRGNYAGDFWKNFMYLKDHIGSSYKTMTLMPPQTRVSHKLKIT
jgi:hypothetical protein